MSHALRCYKLPEIERAILIQSETLYLLGVFNLVYSALGS
jgi:hypothetical protein